MGKSNNTKKSNKKQDFMKQDQKFQKEWKGRSSQRSLEDKARTNNKYLNSEVVEKENDPSWYKTNPQLIDDAGNISFFNQLGRSLEFKSIDPDISPTYKVPGVMVLDMVTHPGISEDVNSATSLSAIGIYEFIRSRLNKAITDYEPGDVGVLIHAMDDVYSQYFNILRLFGIMNTWSGTNLYMPRALVAGAYHMNASKFNEFIANAANSRMRFNRAIDKANSFLFLPVDLSIVTRHTWLFSNVFRDHRTTKGQLYIHAKCNNWKFDETVYDTGAACLYQPLWIPGTSGQQLGGLTIDDYLYHFEDSIERLRNSDMVRAIVADMRQAFQDHNRWIMAYVDERYTVSPVDSDEVLSQIENMDYETYWSNSSRYGDRWNIKSMTDGSVFFSPYINVSEIRALSGSDQMEWKLNQKKLLNLHWDSPTKDDIIEATRNTITYRVDIPRGKVTYASAGADICLGINIIQPSGSNLDGDYDSQYFKSAYVSSDYDNLLNFLIAWTSFDWAPKAYLAITNDEAETAWGYPLVEYDNYTVVDSPVITNLTEACLLNMFRVPGFGTFNLS